MVNRCLEKQVVLLYNNSTIYIPFKLGHIQQKNIIHFCYRCGAKVSDTKQEVLLLNNNSTAQC